MLKYSYLCIKLLKKTLKTLILNHACQTNILWKFEKIHSNPCKQRLF
uniref:Uncharacterized protein n=1 Tax=Anguilla anguilla TaxID=7936 RepID=A0A0E9WCP7_ANGAN